MATKIARDEARLNVKCRPKQRPVGKYTLTYFGVRGRGQVFRYLLLDQGIEYEEDTVTEHNWAEKRLKAPLGKLPTLTDGDKVIAETLAILMYLGRKHDLYPSNADEAWRIDMIASHVLEYRNAYGRMIWENYDGKDDYFKNKIPDQLGYIEKLLKKGEFISSKISWADYLLFDMLDTHQEASPDCLKDFPNLKAFHSKMAERPKIKKHRETEQFKNWMLNGNGKK